MALPESIGQFEHVVLAAVLALDDGAYGVTIHAKVEEFIAPRTVSLGAVYATLDRLEDKGSSSLGSPTRRLNAEAGRSDTIGSNHTASGPFEIRPWRPSASATTSNASGEKTYGPQVHGGNPSASLDRCDRSSVDPGAVPRRFERCGGGTFCHLRPPRSSS
jgi:hypothetical protein